MIVACVQSFFGTSGMIMSPGYNQTYVGDDNTGKLSYHPQNIRGIQFSDLALN